MKINRRIGVLLLIVLIAAVVCSESVLIGSTNVAHAATSTITVAGTQWGVSTCYLGATEGNVRFNIGDLTEIGYNTYRVYGGMQRWEAQDDDGVYGSPTIAQIKANPAVINWAWWDNVMTNPPDGSDYWWSGTPGTTWQGNARTIFQDLKTAGIRPVLTLRNVDNNDNPAWAQQLNPPDTPEDWNEWWEHVFATVYWLNVRNDYRVDDYEVHNEPNNQGQGWGGTINDYYLFTQYTYDAIAYVYATYLPGREFRVYAPATTGGSSWPRDVMINAGNSFHHVDIHNYSGDITGYTAEVHGWMNQYGKANAELWLSEWATYRGGYDGTSLAVKTVVNNMIRGSRPGNDHIDGSHLFTFYDWDGFTGGFQNFEGLVDINGKRLATFYAVRLANRALVGCRPTYQSTSSNTNLLAITTRDASGNYYLLVTNSSTTLQTIDADVSALVSSGTGTQWEFSAANRDVVVASPGVSGGHVTFNVPGTSAVLVKIVPGAGGPTPTPAPGGVMHVSNIAMSVVGAGGQNYRAQAVVTIVDANGVPVGSATVTGSFTGATSSTASAATGANGSATLQSGKKAGGGTWQFCVTNVTRSGWTYDSGANTETCDTVTGP